MNKSESKYFHTATRMNEALLSLLLKKDFEYITVKDICTQADVNRSTFYLHYENTTDLLAEAVTMIHERFQKSIPHSEMAHADISTIQREDLFFITDHWLLPYLAFVKENRHIYKAIHTQMDIFDVERTYQKFFNHIFSPILSRYGVDKEQHAYIMAFYRYGLVAILMRWVSSNCKESATEISAIIELCIGSAVDEKAR